MGASISQYDAMNSVTSKSIVTQQNAATKPLKEDANTGEPQENVKILFEKEENN